MVSFTTFSSDYLSIELLYTVYTIENNVLKMFKLYKAVKLEQYFGFDDITTFYTVTKVTYNVETKRLKYLLEYFIWIHSLLFPTERFNQTYPTRGLGIPAGWK